MSSDFRFNYQKYGENKLTVAKLDQHFEAILQPGSGVVHLVSTVIKMIAFSLYLWTRKGLIEDDYQREKQAYEQTRNQSQRGDLAKDDLD